MPKSSSAEFKSRFLENVSLEEAVFYFVVLLHKLLGFTILEEEMKNNTLASLDETSLLFSLALVVDAALRNKDPNTAHKVFRDFLVFLSQNCSMALNIDDSDFKQLSRESIRDFSKTLQDLLNSRFSLNSGHLLSPIEEDLAITHCFRNFGAHKLEYQPLVIKNFDSILQRLFNLLFFVVERLYP